VQELRDIYAAMTDMVRSGREGFELHSRQIDRLWQDVGELRDEVHALAALQRFPRRERGYCFECEADRAFTEGKCDVCAAALSREGTR
jgi:hypothetical protein